MLLCLFQGLEEQYREELILNVTVFVVRFRGGQYREDLILNVTVFVVRFRGGQYREELILNVTVFVVRFWGGHYKSELILNVTAFSSEIIPTRCNNCVYSSQWLYSIFVSGSGTSNIERN